MTATPDLLSADADTRPLSFAHRVLGSARIAWSTRDAHSFARRSAEATRVAQESRLRRMVEHAYRTVPFYADSMRTLGITSADIRTADDLAHLPIVARAAIQRDPERFLSRARPKSEYLALRTGGSSGAPCVVYHDPVSALENTGHGERHRSVLARLTGKRRFRVLGIGSPRGSEAELRAFVRRHALVPDVAVAARALRTMAEAPEDIARDLAAIRPDVVLSYGSYLERLAEVLEHGRGSYFLPAVLAYGGDAMSAVGRERIVRGLGIRVWSSYQAVECTKIGFECEHHTGLHVHADLCALRIVDGEGRTVPDGTSGEVVISNLVNRGTVLLNYRLGDQAALSPGACPCGSALPLLGFPEGRIEDWFSVPSGERIYTQRLRALFTDEVDVRRYQIVQESVAAVRVAIVAAESADRAALAARVAGALRAVLGPGVALRIDFVTDLERTALGKVRTIIRRAAAVDQSATPEA